MSAAKVEFERIGDYTILSELGRGATSIVYKVERNGKYFALKLMNPSSDKKALLSSSNFRKEAAALAKMSHKNLIRFIEVGEFTDRSYVVMELVGGSSLTRKIKDGFQSDQELIQIFIQIAQGLSQVHRNGLIHQDLKPDNILLNEKNEVKIIDFGFAEAVDMGKINQQAAAGTLGYSSPEQCQDVGKPLDHRTDLYSLGAVLFECLTGETLFATLDAGQLVHKILNEVPREASAVKPDVRPILSEIAKKLVSKNPDQRYQSADGLAWDLEKIQELELAQAAGQLQLDQHSQRVKTSIDVPLIGRDKELTTITSAWDQARKGVGCLVQIEGEGGSGKTRLTHELLQVCASQSAFIIKGKCQQGDNTPLGVVRQAFDDYFLRIQSMPEKDRETAVQKIKFAAGDGKALLKRVSKGFASIFADVPDTPLQDASIEKERLLNSVAHVLLELGRSSTPFLFLVDDTQWIDPISLQVFRIVASDLSKHRMFILTTARNDHQSGAAAAQFLEEVKACEPRRVTLAPLDNLAISLYIKTFLGGRELPEEIVERLTNITNGNIFAIREYIMSMLDSGMLTPVSDGWSVNTEEFEKLVVCDNVLQLIVNRISSLSSESRLVLSMAAVLGMRFKIDHLIAACGLKPLEVQEALTEAIRANLIENIDESVFAIIHDRVREALLQSLSDIEIKDAHQSIADVLVQKPELTPEYIFSCARHSMLGYPERNPLRAFKTTFKAGQLALENYANETALSFLEQAIHYADQCSVDDSERLSLNESMGQACYRSAHLSDSVKYFEKALSYTKDPIQRAQMYGNLCWALDAMAKYDSTPGEIGAWDRLKAGFEDLNVPYPKLKKSDTLFMFFYWILAAVLARKNWFFGSAKGKAREKALVASSLYDIGSAMAFRTDRPPTMLYFTILNFYNAHFLGVCREYITACYMHGWVISFVGMYKPATKLVQKAMTMAEQMGDGATLAVVQMFYVLTMGATNNRPEYDRLIQKAFRDLRQFAPGHRVTWSSVSGHFLQLAFRGKSKAIVDFAQEYLETLKKFGNFLFLSKSQALLYAHLELMGRHDEAVKYGEIVNDPTYAAEVARRMGQQHISYIRIMIALNENRLEGADLENDLVVVEASNCKHVYLRDMHIIVAYARRYMLLQQNVKADAKKKFHRILKKIEPTCKKLPVHRCHLLTLQAADLAAKGRYQKALENLQKAEKDAEFADSDWGKYEIAREQARVLFQIGEVKQAEEAAQKAYKVAAQQGWKNRCEAVLQEFTIKAEVSKAEERNLQFELQTKKFEHYMQSLLKISLASASTLKPEQQARAALDELIKVLKADRAFLFRVRQDSGSGEMYLQAGRDAEGADLPESKGFSTTVVRLVAEKRKPLVVSGTDEGEVLGSESAVIHNLRSIIAAPIMVQEELLGVVYLDHRATKGLFTNEDVDFLSAIVNHIAIAVKLSGMAEIEAQRRAFEKDMELAAAVQSFFLPEKTNHQGSFFELAGFYEAASHVSGDWWWYDSHGEELSVLSGDITGHGAAPAMLTASSAAQYRMLRKANPEEPLNRSLEKLNKEFCLISKGNYLMALSGVQVTADLKLRWWNAGATPLALLRKTGKFDIISDAGTQIGFENLSLGYHEEQLEKGDRLILYTDGLSELMLADGRQISERRVMKMFMSTLGMDVYQSLEKIKLEIRDLRKDRPLNDDISLIIIDLK